MPLTGVFLLPPTVSGDTILANLRDVFPCSSPAQPFSLRHSMYRLPADLSTKAATFQPQSQTTPHLQMLTLSTNPGYTALCTVHPTETPGSAVLVPSGTSSGVAAFSLLLGTKMTALWAPVRQHDLIVQSYTAGASSGGGATGGRVMQVGAFKVCLAELVFNQRGQGSAPGSTSAEARSIRGVAVAVQLDDAEELDDNMENSMLDNLGKQDYERFALRQFRTRLGLMRLDEGAATPAMTVVEEFWGDTSSWQGEVALWCEVLRHRTLSGVARKNEAGR